MKKSTAQFRREIAMHIAEVIGEMSGQVDGDPADRMVDIDDNTPDTIPLTDRILERYTPNHLSYYRETLSDLGDDYEMDTSGAIIGCDPCAG